MIRALPALRSAGLIESSDDGHRIASAVAAEPPGERPRGDLTSPRSPRTVDWRGSADDVRRPSGRLPRQRRLAADERIDLSPRAPACRARSRAAVDGFERHLRLERNRSAHTVRGYVADVVSVLEHARDAGSTTLAELDLAHPAELAGRASTARRRPQHAARRAAAVRTFTAWARTSGLIDADPGQLLASPRPHRTLPPILGADEAIALMEVDAATLAPSRCATG